MLKTESLTDGNTGDPKSPASFYVEGVSFQVFSSASQTICVVGKKNSSTVVTISVYRQTRTFHVLRAAGGKLEVDHIYAIERLLQSYALTLHFPVSQILLPLYGSIGLKNEVEYSGDLETFPPLNT
jgi:hypothetical protein